MTSRCLGLLFSLFLRLFCPQQKIYWLQKYLTENIEAIGANSFKIRVIENRDKRAIVGRSHFSDEFVYVSPECVSV